MAKNRAEKLEENWAKIGRKIWAKNWAEKIGQKNWAKNLVNFENLL